MSPVPSYHLSTLPTPRSSTSPPSEDLHACKQQYNPKSSTFSAWPGRGRPPWRAGQTPPPYRQKRRALAAFMAPTNDNASSHKKQRTGKATQFEGSTDFFANPINWQFRRPTPSSSRRSSPVRGTLEELRNSKPKIEIESHTTLPEGVLGIFRNLKAVARKGYIPLGLRENLKRASPLEEEDIPEEAYDGGGGKRMASEERAAIWAEIQRVHKTAVDCERHQQDENAWSDGVVMPILHWGDDPTQAFFDVINVKTQTLYTDYLPRTVQGETFQKKTDYTLAFSHTHPDIEPYYEKVSFGGRTAALSQMNDSYTRMLAMMVGVEVKAAYGDETEARVQLAVWTSAGLTSIRCLTKEAVGDVNAMNHIPLFGWTVVGQQWDMYIGLVNNGDTGDAILYGPLPIVSVNTRLLVDCFKLKAVWKEIKRYGREEYWNALKDHVLKPLAEGRPIMADSTATTQDPSEDTAGMFSAPA